VITIVAVQCDRLKISSTIDVYWNKKVYFYSHKLTRKINKDSKESKETIHVRTCCTSIAIGGVGFIVIKGW
jgi:hypothetical protein